MTRKFTGSIFNHTSTGEVRRFLQSNIDDLEQKATYLLSIVAIKKELFDLIYLINKTLEDCTQQLSNLYLEYAFTYLEYTLTPRAAFLPLPEEALVYADRAVYLNPNIKVSQELTFLKDCNGMIILKSDSLNTIDAGVHYSNKRTEDRMIHLESFLKEIKDKTKWLKLYSRVEHS